MCFAEYHFQKIPAKLLLYIAEDVVHDSLHWDQVLTCFLIFLKIVNAELCHDGFMGYMRLTLVQTPFLFFVKCLSFANTEVTSYMSSVLTDPSSSERSSDADK